MYTDPDSDDITVEGTIRLCQDLGMDSEDVVLLAVALELKSMNVGEWNRAMAGGMEEYWLRLHRRDEDHPTTAANLTRPGLCVLPEGLQPRLRVCKGPGTEEYHFYLPPSAFCVLRRWIGFFPFPIWQSLHPSLSSQSFCLPYTFTATLLSISPSPSSPRPLPVLQFSPPTPQTRRIASTPPSPSGCSGGALVHLDAGEDVDMGSGSGKEHHLPYVQRVVHCARVDEVYGGVWQLAVVPQEHQSRAGSYLPRVRPYLPQWCPRSDNPQSNNMQQLANEALYGRQQRRVAVGACKLLVGVPGGEGWQGREQGYVGYEGRTKVVLLPTPRERQRATPLVHIVPCHHSLRPLPPLPPAPTLLIHHLIPYPILPSPCLISTLPQSRAIPTSHGPLSTSVQLSLPPDRLRHFLARQLRCAVFLTPPQLLSVCISLHVIASSDFRSL
ncbi:hypothetical protein K438DRAFT_1749776 [Mycena galopus ATCC 62051]|nr:hypothetical protein K438DRAFT_1749776 [Mycena galopus ATCC 62051]